MRNTSPDRAPRTSHKLVGSWGAPGPPIGATHPQPAMAAGVADATGGSSAVRTPTRYPTRAPGPFGPGGSQCRSGKFGRGTGRPPKEGAANEPWKERFFSRAVCSPPLPGGGRRRCSGPGARRVAASLLGRRDYEAPRPQGGTRRAVTEAGCSTGSTNNPCCRGLPSSTDTGNLVDQTALDPGGGSARPQSSAPGGRARVSRASSRPRRGPRDRPRSPPAGRGARRPRAPRPGPRSGRRCPALARRRARVTAVTTREEIACLDSKGSAGGRQSSNLRGEAPTDDGSRPSASSTEVARWTDPLP
jgi:hypothetical protein